MMRHLARNDASGWNTKWKCMETSLHSMGYGKRAQCMALASSMMDAFQGHWVVSISEEGVWPVHDILINVEHPEGVVTTVKPQVRRFLITEGTGRHRYSSSDLSNWGLSKPVSRVYHFPFTHHVLVTVEFTSSSISYYSSDLLSTIPNISPCYTYHQDVSYSERTGS